MKKVFKYEFPIKDEFSISLPAGAQLLDVQVQGDDVYIWALVDPTAPTHPRYFRCCGTGHPMPDGNYIFIGTFQFVALQMVFHLFEVV